MAQPILVVECSDLEPNDRLIGVITTPIEVHKIYDFSHIFHGMKIREDAISKFEKIENNQSL